MKRKCCNRSQFARSTDTTTVVPPHPLQSSDDIPDYMALTFVKLTEEFIPKFLVEYGNEDYMIYGGRAVNAHVQSEASKEIEGCIVPSGDWDIVFGSRDKSELLNRYVNPLVKYLSKSLSSSKGEEENEEEECWTRIPKVISEATSIGYMYKIFLIDPYSSRKIAIADISFCHDSSINGVGDLCSYFDRRVKFPKDNLICAPKDFLIKETVGTQKARNAQAERNLRYLKTDYLKAFKVDPSRSLETLKKGVEKLQDEMQEILDEFAESEEADAEKIETLKEGVDLLVTAFLKGYEDLTLVHKDAIKAIRTDDRVKGMAAGM